MPAATNVTCDPVSSYAYWIYAYCRFSVYLCSSLPEFNVFHKLFESSESGSIAHEVPQPESSTAERDKERIDWIDWVTHARTSKLLYIQNRSVIKKSGRIDRIPIPNPSHRQKEEPNIYRP